MGDIELAYLDLHSDELVAMPRRTAERQADTRAALDQIAEWLDNPPKRRDWYNVRLPIWAGCPGKYPRVVDQQGAAPEQYRRGL